LLQIPCYNVFLVACRPQTFSLWVYSLRVPMITPFVNTKHCGYFPVSWDGSIV